MAAVHDSTHWLKCRQQIGRSGRYYRMACDVLKEMPDGRIKIRVYGLRNWGGDSNRIRYVSAHRISSRVNVASTGETIE